MIGAVTALSALGLFFGIVLGIAGKKLHVENDPRVDLIIEALPGANCGACGFPGCAGYAEEVVAGNAKPNACGPGGPDCAARISEIMGLAVDENAERLLAHILCSGTDSKAKAIYRYQGIPSCTAAVRMFRGPKECDFGCFELGTCIHACPFDAIHYNVEGHPVVDKDLCTGCGICVGACPQSIIKLIPESQNVFVDCSNVDKGKDARKVCQVACIKCKKCERVCPVEAIKVVSEGTGSLAVIDENLCTNCGLCVDACPTGCIQKVESNGPEKKPKLTVKVGGNKAEHSCEGCRACG